MLRAILTGGVFAGLAFIIPAVLAHTLAGMAPTAMLHFIASGVLGAPAYEGGWPTALVGLVLHMGLSLAWAAIWIGLARRYEILLRRPWQAGAVYGVLIWAMMTFVLLPLSRAVPDALPGGMMMLAAAVAHIVLIGWPIAWTATFLAPRREDQPR